jgi:2-dehydro-3-deoxyphosphogluconate aldolase/(4S)-4-hydroxy-2-oxoglutarate aldolase
MNQLLTKALQQKILPAIVFYNEENALPVAEAFLAGGLNVIEIPVRTPVALNVISAIRKKFPDMHVGAGTLLKTETLDDAVNAGAQFGLSSSLNVTICNAASDKKFPFIPGVMTPSEIELAYDLGYDIQKLFPASQIGGVAFLKAMLGPYEQLNIQFVPMGGINNLNMHEYHALKNVIAIGGSWLASKKMMDAKDYKGIEATVKQALHQINNNAS